MPISVNFTRGIHVIKAGITRIYDGSVKPARAPLPASSVFE
jgi:hypothetical protein